MTRDGTVRYIQRRDEIINNGPAFDFHRAVALAQAQSGSFEHHGNEEIPQAVIEWLYAHKYIRSETDQTGEGYVYVTENGERLLTWLLRRALR